METKHASFRTMSKMETLTNFNFDQVGDNLVLEVPGVMSLVQSAKSSSHMAKYENEDLAKVKIKVFRGHEDEVNKCQFFSDESRIMSASADCSIKIWDPHQGTVIHTLEDVHALNTADVHCMDDGSKFVSCGWDKKLNVFDMEKGKPIWTAHHKDMLTCCNFSNDGRQICVGSDHFAELSVYDLASGEMVQCATKYHNSSMTSCLFTPDDGRVITTSTDYTAKFYDLCSEKCTVTLEGHENAISACSITMDERKFATTSWDKTIRIWDVATGMYRSKGPMILKGSHDGSITSCSFSEDGLQLVTGSADNSVVVWDVENSVQKIKLLGHTGWVTDVRFSQDQCWLLTCAKDKTVRMWNIQESDTIPIVMENRMAHGLKVSKCSNCGKPFSMLELENFKDVTICVFCRLQSPEKHGWLFKMTHQSFETWLM